MLTAKQRKLKKELEKEYKGLERTVTFVEYLKIKMLKAQYDRKPGLHSDMYQIYVDICLESFE